MAGAAAGLRATATFTTSRVTASRSRALVSLISAAALAGSSAAGTWLSFSLNGESAANERAATSQTKPSPTIAIFFIIKQLSIESC